VGVTVTSGISVSGATVGAGLQSGALNATLGSSTHGGVTVRVESADPSVMRVSPNASTAGAAFIDVVVPNGQNLVTYHVHGIEGTTGTVPLTVSAPGFASNIANVNVVTPAVDIASLNASYAVSALDDVFQVRIGVPNGTTSVALPQAIRVGGSALTATITSSNVAAAQLVTSSDTGATIMLQILPGQDGTPTSVAAGGVAIDPLATGQTTVGATIPGLIVTTNASQNVTITP
jgi:hypothetical protein